MRSSYLLGFVAACPRFAAGLTVEEASGGLVVSTEGAEDFTVTIDGSGSITSILYGGEEYQSTSQSTHIASGLGEATVSHTISGVYAVVSVVANNADFDLTHYLIFQDGASAIYLATNTNAEPAVGELRYIARLINLPGAYKEGDVSAIVGGTAIEAEDVYEVDGETRSKFYSSQRFIEDDVYCAQSSDASVNACFVSDVRSREKSSGGPFFRDIDLNLVDDYHSVTFYMNSNHAQTEAYRTGFNGPYILSFSASVPSWSDFDTSFFEDLALDGYVGASGRGFVTGTASGTSADFPAVVHWYNDDYQSWATVESGSFTSPALVAGTYTQALYQGELLAATTTVDVAAGATASASIAADNAIITEERTTIWQLGEYDGTPAEFLNADKQLRMHPSDSRMSSWTPGDFIIGTNDVSEFPMAIFQAVNNGLTINFTIADAVESGVTLRIATTLAFASGRPTVSLNGVAGETPAAPTKIDSRGVTRGAYRGLGEVYTFPFDAGSVVQGDNGLVISVASGSSGEEFLSPNFIFDAIELYYV